MASSPSIPRGTRRPSGPAMCRPRRNEGRTRRGDINWCGAIPAQGARALHTLAGIAHRRHAGRGGEGAARRADRICDAASVRILSSMDVFRGSGAQVGRSGPIPDYREALRSKKVGRRLSAWRQATCSRNLRLTHRRRVLLGIVLTFS
jgi:hypothetical protein